MSMERTVNGKWTEPLQRFFQSFWPLKALFTLESHSITDILLVRSSTVSVTNWFRSHLSGSSQQNVNLTHHWCPTKFLSEFLPVHHIQYKMSLKRHYMSN